MKKQILTMFTGLFIGAIITGGASAYAAGILAERSSHRIFVDGQEVQMEAYGIAGHNYDNSMFFSNLSLLNIDDEIYLYDTDNKKYIYKIFKTYEVVPSDLSPVFEFEYNSKELTLITCNNLNSNRLIVKSKQI